MSSPVVTDASPLTLQWRRWVAANRVRGTPEDALIAVLVGRGVPEDAARDAVQAVGVELFLEAAAGQQALVDKYERQLDTYRTLFHSGPGGDQIPRAERPSREEFHERFYAANRAVVLEGVMGESATLRWTPSSLRERFGDELIEVQTNRRSVPVWDVFLKGKTERMLLREYVDMVEAAGETNAFYMTGNDGFLARDRVSDLTAEVDFGSEYLEAESLARNAHLWFGPKGAVSPLHRDRVNVLKAQVYGRKRILMAHSSELARVYNRQSFYSEVDAEAPDLDRFPLFGDVKLFEVVLEPGDCLFIPVGWWHHVRSLDVSMSLTFTNFVFANRFT